MITMIKAHARQAPRRRLLAINTAFLLILFAALLASGISQLRADDANLAPNTDYQPQEVVKIVINALQSNSEDANDDGIATVFRFASPGNRAQTGPLKRFTNMIRIGYPEMLNHAEARFDPIAISGETAVQAVWLYTDEGVEIGYAFQLGRQQSGEFQGMWMTDSVIPLGKGPNSGTRI